MKTTPFVAAVFAALALSASAQDSTDRPRPPRPGPPGPLFSAIDTDKDHTLSASEIAAATESLKTLDKNSDGAITLDEVKPPAPPADGEAKDGEEAPPQDYDRKAPEGGEGKQRPPRPQGPQGPQGPPLFAALDTDHDGTISATELAGAPDSLKKLDKNSDGQVTPEELRPDGPPPHEGGRPPGPPPEGAADGRPPGPPRGEGGRPPGPPRGEGGGRRR